MMARGSSVSVGSVRRALSALTDDAQAIVFVSDGRGRTIEPTGISVEAETFAESPDGGFAVITTSVAERLALGPAAVAAGDAIDVAWRAVAESGRCPLRETARVLARGGCASDVCQAWELGAECDAGWPRLYGTSRGGGRDA